MALGVTVDFNANVARFSQQIDRISGDLGRFEQRAAAVSAGVGKAFEALGVGLSVAGIGAFLKAGIDDLDAFNDMADRTGIAVEELAGLQIGLKLADTTAEAFADTANKLSINIGKNSEDFAKLGVTARDPLEAMIQFADVFSSVEDAQTRAALGAKVLGRSYAELAPLLLQGGAAIREQIADGKRWTGITAEMARQAGEFNDALDTLTFRMQALKVRAVGPLLEGITLLIDHFKDVYSETYRLDGALVDLNDAGADAVSWIDPFVVGIAEINYVVDRAALGLTALTAKMVALATFDFQGFAGIGEKFDADVATLNQKLDALKNKVVDGTQEIAGETGKAAGAAAAASQQAVQAFIGADGAGESGNRRVAASVDALQSRYQSLVASLEREIALRGDNSAAAQMEYDVISGSLRGLGELQKVKLLNLAAEKDAVMENIKAYQEYDAIIEGGLDLAKKQRDEMEALTQRLTQKFDAPRQDFIGGIGDVQDALFEGIIDENRAKAEFDKLGKVYNESFVDRAIAGTDSLSEFSIQAARNMQTAFADFLFDPFSNGVEGMVDNFATALRRMAAEAISAQIFDGLKNSFNSASSSSNDSGSGFFGSLFSGVSSLFGGGSSGGAAAVDDMMYVAKGNVFDRGEPVKFAQGGAFAAGNVIPFAKGDIFDKPMTFPMPKGKLGMMGEAGPEAIMPLTRGPDGKLGVRASGSGGSGGGMTIIQNLYFDSSTPRDVRRATGQAARDALGMLNGAARYG
jgi:hypothetical protein